MTQRNLQINNCRGSKVKVMLKTGQTLTGDLAFYNYDEQVIHVENYFLMDKEVIIESGDFWIVNTRSWSNLSVTDVKEDENEENIN